MEIFGPGFLTAYGDKPSPLWTSAVGSLSDDECRAGLAAIAKQGRDYPANLSQFMAACKSKPLMHTLGPPTTPAALRALERPKVPVEVAQKWIKRMRERLGGTT